MLKFVVIFLFISSVIATNPPPPIGSRVSLTPLSNTALGVRHCDYVCSASPTETGNDDFHFDIITPLNGANPTDGYMSLRSVNLIIFFLQIIKAKLVSILIQMLMMLHGKLFLVLRIQQIGHLFHKVKVFQIMSCH
jgi:hypothetical protein